MIFIYHSLNQKPFDFGFFSREIAIVPIFLKSNLVPESMDIYKANMRCKFISNGT
jgi:hypothetical protein